MYWLNWLCIDFVIEWLCVQTLLRTNLTFFFAKISFGIEMKRQSNPSCQERQPSGLGDNQIMVLD